MNIFLLQGTEVYATCRYETVGKHAYAVGANKGCKGLVSYHWSHYVRQ